MALVLMMGMAGIEPVRAATPRGKSTGTSGQPPAPKYTREVRSATSRLKIDRARWKMIVCHHSGIKQGNAVIYDKDHRRRGMENGLAYHFVIGNGVDSGDGEIEIGSRWLKQIQGGHVRSDEINNVAIGICLVGDYNEVKPTGKQIAALKELVAYLRKEALGKRVRFTVHKEVDPRHSACPGRHFPAKKLHRYFDRY